MELEALCREKNKVISREKGWVDRENVRFVEESCVTHDEIVRVERSV